MLILNGQQRDSIIRDLDVDPLTGLTTEGNPFKDYRTLWEVYHARYIPRNYVIDHINGNRQDCSIWNLRAVTREDNNRNRYPYNKQLNSHRYERRLPPIPYEYQLFYVRSSYDVQLSPMYLVIDYYTSLPQEVERIMEHRLLLCDYTKHISKDYLCFS